PACLNLLGGHQLVVGLRLRAQALNRIHHVRLPGEHGAAEGFCPVELVVHHVEHTRRACKGLDTVVPRVLVDCHLSAADATGATTTSSSPAPTTSTGRIT